MMYHVKSRNVLYQAFNTPRSLQKQIAKIEASRTTESYRSDEILDAILPTLRKWNKQCSTALYTRLNRKYIRI